MSTDSTEWDPFKRPIPRIQCLTHETVLLQAWKKAHSYLRNQAWYADVLELDNSAMDLRAFVHRLNLDLTQRDDAFRPKPMKLVLAPKSDPHGWRFVENRWQPGLQSAMQMRPLAHLQLRDQVVNMAAVITLADAIETAQGDTEQGSLDARKHGVTSYGNRLFCDWRRNDSGPPEAEFCWGNASLFRKYFVDYQQFLRRPLDICQSLHALRGDGRELGVVSLDLRSFYDNIEVGAVIAALKSISESHGQEPEDEFWNAIEQAFSWHWSATVGSDKDLVGGELPKGLPQGLVASGVYSNAYMHNFDATVLRKINRRAKQSPAGIMVLDYCRYVDDLRLVVEGDSGTLRQSAIPYIEKWLTPLMTELIPTQSFNASKSCFVSMTEMQSRAMRPTVMAAIQHTMSGPVDVESLEEVSITIDGLLSTVGSGSAAAPGTQADKQEPSLARIHQVHHIIRDDTVIRFSSYRKLKTLRMLRFYYSAESEGDTTNHHLVRIDAEMEVKARELIWLWSRDPSLAIVLRHAFNMYPSPVLLRPVIESLQAVLNQKINTGIKKKRPIIKGTVSKRSRFARKTAFYAAAELFKAGVVETAIDVSDEELPTDSDIDGYREMLADFAEQLLRDKSSPWYVAEQAVLLLLSVNRNVALDGNDTRWLDGEYRNLCELAFGGKSESEHGLSLILVLDQLQGKRKQTIRRLIVLAESYLNDHDKVIQFIESVCLANPEICRELAEFTAGRPEHRDLHDLLSKIVPERHRRDSYSTKTLARTSTLYTVMRARDNPFIQEIAALQLLRCLAQSILDGKLEEYDLHPARLKLSVKRSWSRLQFPTEKPAIQWSRIVSGFDDVRYLLPDWLHGERRRLYSVGRLVRAAMLGIVDYTAMAATTNQLRDGYVGCRTSWYKRQHGLFGGLSLSRWEACSCSPWMESLLMHLLRWPGCRSESNGTFDTCTDIGSLLRLANARLARLRSQYGRASGVPVYDVPIRASSPGRSVLSMALIQNVRPTRKDLESYGVELDSPHIRPVHRKHLAAVLRLAWEHAKLRSSYGKPEQLDIVVLPEIAVHRNDIDLLERFIDATHAIIFCGLAIYRHDRLDRLVNAGLWIIPERSASGRRFRYLLQGKHNMMKNEESLGVTPHRPHQYILKFNIGKDRKPIAISGAICFDATDLRLATDLRDQTDMLIIPAHNQDVPTFDSMATALSWHMFQHVVVVNSGEFGGTVVTAPYKERYERTLVHDHGGMQAAFSIVDVDLSDYQRMRELPPKLLKSPPAGFGRH